MFHTQIEQLILRDDRLAPQYQIELMREGALDAMTVVVEPAAGRVFDQRTL